MVSFEVVGGTRSVEILAANLRCFTLAESLGGVESLIAHPATMTHSSMEPAALAAAGISDSLVRLSVGIESPEDLAHDLANALDEVARATEVHVSAPKVTMSLSRHGEAADIVLLGVGAIGRELIAQLNGNSQEGTRLRVCGLVDRSGYVFAERGLSRERLAELRALKAAGQPLVEAIDGRPGSATEALREMRCEALERPILVDVTAADTSDALRVAVSRGFDLVLANKAPLAAKQSVVDELRESARRAGRSIRYEATVGAGLPVLDTLHKLLDAGDDVLSIEGCPSGTLGFLFGEMGHGEQFSVALQRAIALGYTEPDPRVDLSGVDVARKALILARTIGFRGELSDVQVESLVPNGWSDLSREEFLARLPEVDESWASRVNALRRKGNVLRYRAHLTPESIRVGLATVRLTERLGILDGTDNQFTFTTTRYRAQPLVITGPGAGPAVTAAGVFNDLLSLARPRGRDASSPWTPHSGFSRTRASI